MPEVPGVPDSDAAGLRAANARLSELLAQRDAEVAVLREQLAVSLDITWEARMTDMLIRDVPDDVIAALEAHARRLGLSRTEYVRRRLAQDAAVSGSPVSTGDLTRFTETFSDLADPDVMSRAWQ